MKHNDNIIGKKELFAGVTTVGAIRDIGGL
jgi:hypothetical protein